ncbi:methyl-accepting chemotaxis protein [Oceanospirillum sanctuarii]|uniref:methyl-accepting chemotaxis protein n=1 Tax=Oceanospirillum sanctuarii TaxID=1434821 RepID=UPI000A38CCDB|nr:PAS domain-containing methyl-accepting chemotaxis protein [Oceanospirillum sanctuarii]
MKQNLPVTGQETLLADGIPLVSTTDLKGKITYVNEAFVEISGFSEDELMGQPHNIVRHPDVPPAIFQEMWNTVSQGKPWMGVVKNRCKNGDHYYVNAFVSATLKNGEVTGYQSVRLPPKRSQVERAERIYKRVNAGKRRIHLIDIPILLSLPVLVVLACLSPFVLQNFGGLSGWQLMLWSGVSSALLALAGYKMMGPLKFASRLLVGNDYSGLLAQMYSDSSSEAGFLRLMAKLRIANEDAIRTRIHYSADMLASLGKGTQNISDMAAHAVQQQNDEVKHISQVVSEMSEAIETVANRSAEASEATREGLQQAENGRVVVNETMGSIRQLSDEVKRAASQVDHLHSASEDISNAVSLINDIATQTNLLALNAAIEAARAGEHGRGFAVVADEVRSLASRTQQSTHEIQQTLTRLMDETKEVYQVMNLSRQQAKASVEQAEVAGATLEQIASTMRQISERGQSIAAAARQQSIASGEINKSLQEVTSGAEETEQAAQQTRMASAKLSQHVAVIMESIAGGKS